MTNIYGLEKKLKAKRESIRLERNKPKGKVNTDKIKRITISMNIIKDQINELKRVRILKKKK